MPAATDGTAPDATDPERLQRDLHRRYHGRLYRYVLPMVDGDRQFAEDVVQETMLRAWLHIDELAPEQAGGWLYTVARHLAISLYHRRRRARPAEVPIEGSSSPMVDPELERVLDASELRAALGSLRPEHRNVIVQLFYLQRSVAEAAAVLDIPAGTVKSRAFYALRALRVVLDERGLRKP